MILGSMGEGLLSSSQSSLMDHTGLTSSGSGMSINSMSLGPPSPPPILPSFGFTQEQVRSLCHFENKV